MRPRYSAQAASAQPGSLALTATTRSLGMRFFRFEGFGFFHSDRLAAPDFLEVVEAAHRGMHDVHHDVAEIDQHPIPERLAFDAVDARAVLPHLVLHAVGKRLHLARRIAARDHHALEHRGHARGIEDDDVVPLDVLQRLDHYVLLAAEVHLAVEPVARDIARDWRRHQRREVLAARGALADFGAGDVDRRHLHDDRRFILEYP